jgi:hypothetical protein
VGRNLLNKRGDKKKVGVRSKAQGHKQKTALNACEDVQMRMRHHHPHCASLARSLARCLALFVVVQQQQQPQSCLQSAFFLFLAICSQKSVLKLKNTKIRYIK